MEHDERLLTSYHEAGHWVAGYVLGHDAWDSVISVRPEGDWLGFVQMRGASLVDENLWDCAVDRDRVEERVVVLYAGWAASAVKFPELAETEAARASRHEDCDFSRARRLLAWARTYTPTADSATLRERAAELVTRHWSKLEEVVAEMMRRDRLEGRDAYDLFHDAGSDAGREHERALEARQKRGERRDLSDKMRALDRAGFDTDCMTEEDVERAYDEMAGFLNLDEDDE